MLNRNPMPPWLVISIFLAVATAVPLTHLLRSWAAAPPRGTTPRTLTELAELLSQAAPELRVVPMAKYGSVESGMYLCNDSRSWEKLALVRRNDPDAGKWRGVVYCEHESANTSLLPEWEIETWGEHAMKIETILFFGDPELLQRVDKIIRSHAKREQR